MRKVTCIFMPLWEFDQIIEEIFDGKIVAVFDGEDWTFYDKEADDYIPVDVAYIKIARRLGVDHISSIHRNVCYEGYEESEIWITYQDKEGNQ